MECPPESVSASRPPVLDRLTEEPPVIGTAGQVTAGDQHQVLGQVTQALTSLVAQLTAASGHPTHRCGGEGTWAATCCWWSARASLHGPWRRGSVMRVMG